MGDIGTCRVARRERVAGSLLLLLLAACLIALPLRASAQLTAPPPAPPPAAEEERPEAPEKVDVRPEAQDSEIRQRLQDIIDATGWFTNARVIVRDGVVFLSGQAENAEHRRWAGDLARNTEDVAAVVNQIEIRQRDIWDFEPSLAGLRDLWRSIIWAMPFVILSLLILALTIGAALLTARLGRRLLRPRMASPLLRNVTAKGFALLVLIIGLYVIFRVAGLTGVAFTVLGGTGLLGLILGIAFREITENFLASIFLSAQHPFRSGDLVQINDSLGFVQQLTTRATVLMTLDGNHLQIPNITVYRGTIRNFTSNCNRREDFTVGIGYADGISHAQQVALNVLRNHPAVLKEPEPWVLVESLGKATVNLRIYFWLDGSEHSWLKVRSSVIRLIKRAFQGAGISMPDEARELVFPEGVPVHLLKEEKEAGAGRPAARPAPSPPPADESDTVTTDSEGGLSSEAGEIDAQARKSRTPEEGENLLRDDRR